jgi:two-component system chemotaxis response regulator CheY
VSDFLTDRPTVLVIEDDEMLRRFLTRTLEYAGYRVFSADNGETAFQIVRGLGSKIGIVLTDIRMPVMDGYEFARAYSALYPSIPILFMTGAKPQGSPGFSLRDVGDRLLLKPFDPETLIEAVNAGLTYGLSARQTTA